MELGPRAAPPAAIFLMPGIQSLSGHHRGARGSAGRLHRPAARLTRRVQEEELGNLLGDASREPAEDRHLDIRRRPGSLILPAPTRPSTASCDGTYASLGAIDVRRRIARETTTHLPRRVRAGIPCRSDTMRMDGCRTIIVYLGFKRCANAARDLDRRTAIRASRSTGTTSSADVDRAGARTGDDSLLFEEDIVPLGIRDALGGRIRPRSDRDEDEPTEGPAGAFRPEALSAIGSRSVLRSINVPPGTMPLEQMTGCSARSSPALRGRVMDDCLRTILE